MEKEFDFKNIGKRMPYSVPEGFFDKMEENVVASLSAANINEKPKKARLVRIVFRFVFSVAAAVALFFVVQPMLTKNKTMPSDDYASVELAFNNLSTDDQDFLIAVYEEEEFINLSNTEDYEEDI